MAVSKPIPLYPTYIELKDIKLKDYADLNSWLLDKPKWFMQHWSWGKSFLEYRLEDYIRLKFQ